MDTILGIELGSTRIKAVTIDKEYNVISSGDYTWKSTLENGIWTYSLDEAVKGVCSALSSISDLKNIKAAAVSGMMHGYLAFDKDWNLLVPFRTWMNSICEQAQNILSEAFDFTVPQRWSSSHLFQAILRGEEHVKDVAHITTIAGYIHHLLTGENVVGIGEASGMFPIDSETLDYNAEMIAKYNALCAEKGFEIKLSDILPRVMKAGENAGYITEEAALLTGLPAGIPLAPPEGDGQTGMTATNSVTPLTGNVSAGTSIFTMVVLDKDKIKRNPNIVIIMTPDGKPVAMVNANNCTSDMNAWVGMFCELLETFGCDVSKNDLFTELYKLSLDGAPDGGGVTVYNFVNGEMLTHMNSGIPMIIRTPDSNLTLSNFIRAQLYSTMSTLRLGMDILKEEGIGVKRLTAHGGLFKTPGVCQKYMASAYDTAITCLSNAGEGGPYGIALLASYMLWRGENQTLDEYLEKRVFANMESVTEYPDKNIADGFNAYMERFKAGLCAEKVAAENM